MRGFVVTAAIVGLAPRCGDEAVAKERIRPRSVWPYRPRVEPRDDLSAESQADGLFLGNDSPLVQGETDEGIGNGLP